MPRVILSSPLHRPVAGPRPGPQTSAGRALVGVSQGLLLTPVPRCLPTSLRLFPVPPWPTPGPALTCPWKRREGQGAARAQEPQGPEQRQPHDSGARGRRGRQVPGRAPSRSGGRVCLAHCAARGRRQAPPLPSHRVPSQAPPRPPRPRPREAPPPGGPASPRRFLKKPAGNPDSARSAQRRRFPAAVLGGSRGRSDRLGRRFSTRRRSGLLPSSVAASRLQPAARPGGDRGQFSPAARQAAPGPLPARVPDPCGARAAGVCSAFYYLGRGEVGARRTPLHSA